MDKLAVLERHFPDPATRPLYTVTDMQQAYERGRSEAIAGLGAMLAPLREAIAGERRDWHRVDVRADDIAVLLAYAETNR